jgi:hypothetical protein
MTRDGPGYPAGEAGLSARSPTITATRIVRGAYDRTFDRTNLPDELILSNYFSVVVFNQAAGY